MTARDISVDILVDALEDELGELSEVELKFAEIFMKSVIDTIHAFRSENV